MAKALGQKPGEDLMEINAKIAPYAIREVRGGFGGWRVEGPGADTLYGGGADGGWRSAREAAYDAAKFYRLGKEAGLAEAKGGAQ